MVGREVTSGRPAHVERETAPLVFKASEVSTLDGRVDRVSFELRRGEILGFAGLIGSGRSELMEALFGARPLKSGQIEIQGRSLRIRSPYEAVKAGMAFVTEDRRHTGFFHNFSIAQNISILPFLKSARASSRWSAWICARRRCWAGSTGNCCASAAPRRSRTSPNSPAATSRRRSSPNGWRPAASCSSSTSRPAASTSAPRARSTRSCGAWRTRAKAS